jgi:competence protein ComEC
MSATSAAVAKDLVVPADALVFRTTFLYVGQGDSTLHVMPDGKGGRLYVLVDINVDSTHGGTDVVSLLEDVLPSVDGKPTLDYFINTHPHNDHICGLDQLRKRVRVKNVWHTGFVPSDKHSGNYKHLEALIRDVEKNQGKDCVFEYQGSRREEPIGAVEAHIVAPARYVKDEISELEGEARDCRIHEFCGVFRFGYGSDSSQKHVLHTGDSDRCAWEKHILGDDDYHADRLPSAVVNASHHGANTFFFNGKPDEEKPYERHIELIDPTWVIISSPTQSESQHGHPNDEAVALYEKHIRGHRAQNVLILGDAREARIYDVFPDGQHVMQSDGGELAALFPAGGANDRGGSGAHGGGGATSTAIGAPTIITSRVDGSRPMGAFGAKSRGSGTP